MVGQASSLSIADDGQDARPTGNLGFKGVPRDAGLRFARNDNFLPRVTEELLDASLWNCPLIGNSKD